ncbi:glycoside hydrolase family 31 protein [Panacibacter sp. DH6]|uniref:Glycoside hydrolase family 31 protein n=1 Tax=Panacibacter microcysteis TaxID=2793269 RepID=A0A931E1F1_9BACT|nr:glycoside hydrolase family 31 protein [Panacibacter microcysteis]MBG9375303.1 glycoside hydrolase family 31 protein [Panacibacter microcysteis]
MKSYLRQAISIVLLFLAVETSAQIFQAGAITAFKKSPGSISGKTTNAIFDVHVYNNNIVRVRVSKEKSFRNFSYALVTNEIPVYTNVVVTEKGNSIILSTAVIELEIKKTPGLAFVFRNKNGKIINEDEAQNGAVSFSGNKVTAFKKLISDERFIGLGEALGNIDRRGTGVTLNNTDNYKYADPRVPMYSSIPFYMGIHQKEVYGLFFNNSHKAFFNFGSSTPYTSVTFDGGEMDYFFLYDTSVARVVEHYTSLTGRMQMPPLWSLGYQQSRCTYYPQDQVMWIAETFRRRQIPLDGIVLDADYQLGYEPFRTNTERFPDMPGLAAQLAKMHIELTASVYPGVHIDSTYDSYTDGIRQNIFIKTTDGLPFQTEIAPLKVHLPDYTDPKARQWWISKMQWMKTNGIKGYWNDMNEPATANSYLPEDLVFDFDGHKATTAEAKNVYGFQMARSSYEAAVNNLGNQRPFILTRSGFAGVQRYSALWSGDNLATDEGLLNSILLNNQLGLSGLPFVGYDVGGYIGDGSKNLYIRWIEAGVFSPYCRNHREFFGTANEPWAYGEEAEAISKTYINFRYRLMPYIYSAMYTASKNGIPLHRSLAINYPFDANIYQNSYQYQFLFGQDMLVAPLTSNEKSKQVYLPQGDWYDLFTDNKIAGAQVVNTDCPGYKLPLFIKASAIIPVQGIVQSTKDKPTDTLFLHVYNGQVDNTYTYYEDDGTSLDYKKEMYYQRDISFHPAARQITIAAKRGAYKSHFNYIQLLLHGFDDNLQSLTVNGSQQSVLNNGHALLDPLDNLGDIYDKGYYKSLQEAVNKKTIRTVTIQHTGNNINILW